MTRALRSLGFQRGRGSRGGLHVLAAEQFPFVPLAGDSKQERAAGRAVSRWPQPREMSCGISIRVRIRLRRWQRHKARRGSAGEEEIVHGDSSCGWVIQGSAGGGHKGTWLTASSLCAAQDANCLRKLILAFGFLSGELFPERSYCIFWNEYCEILFFTVGEFSAGDLSTEYFTGS